MEIRPIHNEKEHRAALERLESLMDAEPGTDEGDELEVLAALIEVYEEKHYPVDPPDPIEAIRFRMDQQGLTQRDLEPYIGPSGRVSEVLNRKRPLTLPMIRRLHEGLGIPLESLIQPVDRAS